MLAGTFKHANARIGAHGIAQQRRGRRGRKVVEGRKNSAEARQVRWYGQRVHWRGLVANHAIRAVGGRGPGGGLGVEVGESAGGLGLSLGTQGGEQVFGAAARARAQLQQVRLTAAAQPFGQQRHDGPVGAQQRNHEVQVVHHSGPHHGREPRQILKLEQPQA